MGSSYPLECGQDPKHTESWSLFEASQFCPVCGGGLVLKLKVCCKRWSEQNANYCSECGKPLKASIIAKDVEAGVLELEAPKKPPKPKKVKKTKKHGGKK